MFFQLHVRKISSLNPDTYTHITLHSALGSYAHYVHLYTKSFGDMFYKNFKQWLDTEI